MKDMNIQALRAKEKKHIPVVLSIDEVKQIISNMNGIYQVMLKLMTKCHKEIKRIINYKCKK